MVLPFPASAYTRPAPREPTSVAGGTSLRNAGPGRAPRRRSPSVAAAVCGALLALAPPAPDARATSDVESAIEDTVIVRVLDREVVGVDAVARGSSSLRLDPGERLLSHEARGRIGIVVTNRRLLGFSAKSGWTERRLRIAESTPSRADVDARLALFLTSQRAIGFDGHWREEVLSPQEAVQRSSLASSTALVVTNRRAMGLSPASGGFVSIPLRVHEDVEQARAVATLAEVTTSQRVLVFSAGDGTWTEELRTLD